MLAVARPMQGAASFRRRAAGCLPGSGARCGLSHSCGEPRRFGHRPAARYAARRPRTTQLPPLRPLPSSGSVPPPTLQTGTTTGQPCRGRRPTVQPPPPTGRSLRRPWQRPWQRPRQRRRLRWRRCWRQSHAGAHAGGHHHHRLGYDGRHRRLRHRRSRRRDVQKAPPLLLLLLLLCLFHQSSATRHTPQRDKKSPLHHLLPSSYRRFCDLTRRSRRPGPNHQLACQPRERQVQWPRPPSFWTLQ